MAKYGCIGRQSAFPDLMTPQGIDNSIPNYMHFSKKVWEGKWSDIRNVINEAQRSQISEVVVQGMQKVNEMVSNRNNRPSYVTDEMATRMGIVAQIWQVCSTSPANIGLLFDTDAFIQDMTKLCEKGDYDTVKKICDRYSLLGNVMNMYVEFCVSKDANKLAPRAKALAQQIMNTPLDVELRIPAVNTNEQSPWYARYAELVESIGKRNQNPNHPQQPTLSRDNEYRAIDAEGNCICKDYLDAYEQSIKMDIDRATYAPIIWK